MRLSARWSNILNFELKGLNSLSVDCKRLTLTLMVKGAAHSCVCCCTCVCITTLPWWQGRYNFSSDILVRDKKCCKPLNRSVSLSSSITHVPTFLAGFVSLFPSQLLVCSLSSSPVFNSFTTQHASPAIYPSPSPLLPPSSPVPRSLQSTSFVNFPKYFQLDLFSSSW